MTTAIILAAGDSHLWGKALEVKKHMIPIKGEPLIHRTQRLLHENGVKNIFVVCKEEDKESFVSEFGEFRSPELAKRDWIQEWDGSRYLWSRKEKTIILYGDCYFSEEILDELCQKQEKDWKVYARWWGSSKTGKDHGEMFAWSIIPEHHEELDKAREDAIRIKESGAWGRCLGWEVYRLANNFEAFHHGKEDVHGIEWDDETEDFDAVSDWDNWLKINKELA
jgi:hypothetical protein